MTDPKDIGDHLREAIPVEETPPEWLATLERIPGEPAPRTIVKEEP